MEWEFTPQQVAKGEAAYGLIDFRRDLMQEVSLNLQGADEEAARRIHALIYDLCYWLSTGHDVQEFAAQFQELETVNFLLSVVPHQRDNVEMLGAILQRMIMDGVETGLSAEDAVARAAERHRLAVGTQPLAALP